MHSHTNTNTDVDETRLQHRLRQSTPTPTSTQTPTQTPTSTQTPTQTPTDTPTQTPIPEYVLTASSVEINEGDPLTITLTTANVPSGTKVGYAMTHQLILEKQVHSEYLKWEQMELQNLNCHRLRTIR